MADRDGTRLVLRHRSVPDMLAVLGVAALGVAAAVTFLSNVASGTATDSVAAVVMAAIFGGGSVWISIRLFTAKVVLGTNALAASRLFRRPVEVRRRDISSATAVRATTAFPNAKVRLLVAGAPLELAVPTFATTERATQLANQIDEWSRAMPPPASASPDRDAHRGHGRANP